MEQAEIVLEDSEQYRMQMAGISTAAFGHYKKGESIHPDYETPALRDVVELYEKYDAKYKLADRLHDALFALREAVMVNPTMQGKEYDTLGIQVCNALAAYEAQLPVGLTKEK